MIICFRNALQQENKNRQATKGIDSRRLALILAIWLLVKEFNEFGGLLGDAINENIASWVHEQNG